MGFYGISMITMQHGVIDQVFLHQFKQTEADPLHVHVEDGEWTPSNAVANLSRRGDQIWVMTKVMTGWKLHERVWCKQLSDGRDGLESHDANGDVSESLQELPQPTQKTLPP